MDYLQAIGAAITFGSALGAIVAGFFAQRQKSLVTLLRESNKDYKDRVEQLEADRDRFEELSKKQADEIADLKRQKMLPLEQLIKLVTQQHADTQKSIMALAKAIEAGTKNNNRGSKQ